MDGRERNVPYAKQRLERLVMLPYVHGLTI